MRALLLAIVGAAAATGCGGPSLQRGEALAGACQFRPCTCADENAPFWRVRATAELIWGEDGAPSCPPGFVLQRADGT
jgi:hypothetical protein